MKNFKAIFLTIIAAFLFFRGTGQTVQWAHKGTSPGYEYGNAITTDDSGNVYVSGQIEYTTHFDNGQNLSSYGIHDIFAGKYGPDGTVKWLRNAGGKGGDVGYGVAVDKQHNCYVTGEIEDTARFSGSVSLISKGGNDIFLSKYNENGSLIWAKSFGSTESDKGYSLITNSNGDVFLTGFYSAHIYFDNIHLTPAGLADVYTMKLNSDGDVQWAKKGAGTENDRGKGITFDRNGNVYVAGYFTSQANFSGTTITNNGTTGGFLVKYDSTGHMVWLKGNCCGTSEYDGIAIDANDNIYTTGYFTGTVTIGTTTLTSSGSSDILIVKYDPSGNILWAKKAGGPYEDVANGISVDSSNQIFYISGQLDDHGNFDSHYVGAAGNRDVFIAAYDLNGNCKWVKPYGGVDRDIAYGVACDPDGFIYTTGVFTDNATFGSYTLTGNLLYDFYVEKVSPVPATPPTSSSSNFTASKVNCSDLFLSFTSGNGSGRIVVAHAGSPVNALPLNANSYTADNSFGAGENLGSGNYVVYNGNDDFVTVTGLTAGVTYYFSVFEYNGAGALISYLTTNPASGSQISGTYSVDIHSNSNAVCIGDTLTLSATGGSAYSWSPSSGLSSSTDSIVNAFPLVTTTYTVTTNINGCEVHNESTITVRQLPVVSLSVNNSICENERPALLTGGLPSGGVYAGAGVSSGTFDPSVAGVGADVISYLYTDANGCENKVVDTIQVLQKPIVSLSLSANICENAGSLMLNGGMPAGGVYSGSGVNAGIFDPALAGTGVTTVLYSYTDLNGCSDSIGSAITVNSAPVISLGNDTTICADHSITLDAGNGYSAYNWSTGSIQSAISIDSSGTGLGTSSVIVEVANSFGCLASDTIMVTFSICTGIENSNSNSELAIYPNPFTESLHLSLDTKADVLIYDATGKLISELFDLKGEINFGSELSPGLYSVIVYQKDLRTIFRVIKSVVN